MGIARSSFYADLAVAADDTALIEAMHAIKDEFEAYGWRRMQAALRQVGWVVNHKKIKRLMRAHGLNPENRRRFVVTTDSDHDQPIFPDRTRELAAPVCGPNQLWVADLTYVAIASGFVYVALIMDAWSRRIVGYAIGRRIDARLTLAALDAAIAARHPPPGCIHHSDRGSQYAALAYRDRLEAAGLVGSMGRRGNPYDNAMAESLMKTLKVEGVYPMAFETFDDVAEQLPRYIDKYNERRLHSALGYRSPARFEEENAPPPVKSAA
jgi:putative transposase